MVRKLILAFGATVLGLSAAACNTIDGAGEDIESVANEVDEEI
jgi:predicted small secreted protein